MNKSIRLEVFELTFLKLEKIFAECLSRQSLDVPRIKAIYDALLKELIGLFESDAGCLVFLDLKQKDFDFVVAFGYGINFEWWQRLTFGKGIVFKAAKSKKIHITQNISKVAEYVMINEGTRAQLTIPLIDNGETFAVFAFEKITSFPNHILKLANQSHIRLTSIVREFQAKLLAKRMEQTFKNLDKISKEEDEHKRIELIMKAAASFIDGGEVAVLRRIGGHLRATDFRNIDADAPIPDYLSIGIAKGKGYTGYVAYTQLPFYCANTLNKKRYKHYREVEKSTRSQYTLPLLFRNELLGVLNIGSKIPYGFTEVDRKLIHLYADHVANAIYYSRIITELRTVYHQTRQLFNNFPFMERVVEQLELSKEATGIFNTLLGSVNNALATLEEANYPLRPIKVKPEKILDLIDCIVNEFMINLTSNKIVLVKNLNISADYKYELMREHFLDVLRNVLWNSVEALTESGKKANKCIEISVSFDKKYTSEYLVVSIVDNGKGLLENTKNIENIYKPGFRSSSKCSTRGGRGMGLWICDHILANYGGFLELEPSMNGGTEATIYLKVR